MYLCPDSNSEAHHAGESRHCIRMCKQALNRAYSRAYNRTLQYQDKSVGSDNLAVETCGVE